MKSIFRSTPRSRRARPQTQEAQAEPQNAFFQPKLSINAPGDAYEREADAVADQVVSQQGRGGPALNGQATVQRKPISRVQRLATPEEDKMPSTNDGRMAEDKRIQEKPEVQRAGEPKEEEKPVQKAEAPKEEEKPVQKMDAPKEEEKPVQKAEAPKEEEKPVQKMDAPKEEEKPVQKAGEEEEVQTKPQGGGTSQASPHFSSRLSARKGGGSPLPATARAQMEQGIGADFSQVRIHTDSEAAQMNKEIHAQAFTHGKDVYFNSGKFSPDSAEGKRLLAHELTHVVQQGSAHALQRKDLPGTSTPIPKGYKTQKDEAGIIEKTTGVTAGVQVTILPDITGETHDGSDASTAMKIGWTTPRWEHTDGKVTKVEGKPVVSLEIQTTYLPEVPPSGESAYGRGTTKKDKLLGNKSLRYHEGKHGQEAISYIRKHALPKFKGKIGLTVEQYKMAEVAFDSEMEAYNSDLQQQNFESVDCVGTPKSTCSK